MLTASVGDDVRMKVVEVLTDGSTADLPATSSVTWSMPATVTALPPGAMAGLALPSAVVLIDNPNRPDQGDDTRGVLFIAGDPGSPSVSIAATVASMGSATADVPISTAPVGDTVRGANLFATNCAGCHGPTGHGSVPNADGKTYTLAGKTYSYPAPGINAEPGGIANDPAWSAALLGTAARADVDNHAVSLREPMPNWLVAPDPATGKPLTTQDFADIFGFLQTQTH
jgi:mono/diheme cytochrome c family protein